MNLSPKVQTEKFCERVNLELVNNYLSNITIDTIYELIRDIKDPEHPLTLEQLQVVKKENIKIYQISKSEHCLDIGLPINCIRVEIHPTIPHCSMAAIIGLSVKFLLEKYIKGYHIEVTILEGTHVNCDKLNKQLQDRDRTQAAFENDALTDLIDECICGIENKFK